MATPQPPLTPEQRLEREQNERLKKIARNVAIGGVIVCPAVALLPPRKLDLYTLALGIGFYLSADHLSTSYTGRGLIENVTPRWNSLPTEKAIETQQRFEAEKSMKEAREAMREGREIRKEEKGILHRLWMGDEEEGWKERRLAEERKALEEGKTYTSMILDQIWEVWNWDKKKDGEVNETSAQKPKDDPKKP